MDKDKKRLKSLFDYVETVKAKTVEETKRTHPVKARTQIRRAIIKRIMREEARTFDKRRYPGRGVARKQRGDED